MTEGFDLYNFLIAILALSGGGILAGILAGLFGIGGGTILVPLLYEFLLHTDVPPEYRMHVALGTSLAIIVPTSLRSYLGHRARGAVNRDLLRKWLIPLPLGVALGAFLAASVPSLVLEIIFAAICLFTAIRFLFLTHGRFSLGEELPQGKTLYAFGAGIGFLASLMGMGGGVLAAMFMALYRRPVHQAVATSAGVGILVSIPGTIGYIIAGLPVMDKLAYWPLGFVALVPLMLIGPLSALSTPVGVTLAHRFSKRTLEIALAIYLLLIAARLIAGLI